MALFRLSDIGVCFGSGSASFYPIRHINISFPKKGLVAIQGKSGSGKSTLLNVISSLLRPSEGQVYFQGQAISRWNPKKLSLWRLHHVGIIFQHYNLIEGVSGLENIELPMKMAGCSKKSAKRRAKSLVTRFGLDELASKNVSKCSGGERQRIAILRSIANDPDIILADEPTGALDEENGLKVMGMLAELAKSKLVIFVSHNEEMVASYSEFIYRIEDGHLSLVKKKEEEEGNGEEIPLRKKHSRRWTFFFTARSFSSHKGKNFLCFLSGIIGYSSLLVAVGFYAGSASCLEREQSRSLEYMKATISEKTYTDIENSPLRLVRYKRPTYESVLDAVEGIDAVVVEPDYSYFFPQYSSFKLNEVSEDGTSFYPCFDLSLRAYDSSFLSQGECPDQNDFSSVLVNEEFCAAFGDCIGKRISFSSGYSFSFKGNPISGELSFSFQIKGVVSEFSFLNSPKVYYSYFGLDQLLASTPAYDGLSIKDVVASGGDQDSFTSLDYYLFAKKAAAVPKLEKRLEELKSQGSFLSIESSCYEVKQAFTSLTDAFSMALLVFVGIAIVGIAIIEGLVGYSNFSASKKEAAILLSLGADKSEINSIYVNESVSVSLFSALLSFCLCPLIQWALNRYIEKQFSLSDLIAIPFLSMEGIPGFLFLLLSLFAMLVSYIGTSFAVNCVKTRSLASELQDE